MKLYYIGQRIGKQKWLRYGISVNAWPRLPVPILLVSRLGVDGLVRQLERVYQRSDIVVMYVDVPRKWLKRGPGYEWECQRDIPPERVLGELFVEE